MINSPTLFQVFGFPCYSSYTAGKLVIIAHNISIAPDRKRL